jgi:hypothetical protein
VDAVEACYSAIKAAFDADTGSGGLRNPSGHQYVNGGIFRAGDPQATRTVSRLEVQLQATQQDSDGDLGADLLARIKIVTHRDLGFARQNAIEERLFDLLHKSESLTATGWSIAPPNRLRPCFQVPPEDGEASMAAVCEYVFHLTE